ncbi:hypothetical protein MTO96_037785, partial [Rhipicephalus appendiculatus]
MGKQRNAYVYFGNSSGISAGFFVVNISRRRMLFLNCRFICSTSPEHVPLTQDVLAATLGFWAARAIISAQRDVAPGWGLATCLSAQAGVGLSVREKDALFTAALAFKVSL